MPYLGEHHDLAEKLQLYRQAYRERGHEAEKGPGEVMMVLHLYVEPKRKEAVLTLRGPMPTKPTATIPAAEEGQAFYRELERHHLVALWTVTANLLPREPRGRAVPYLWRWDTLLPLVKRAGELAPLHRGAERRVLSFINPGLPTRYAPLIRCGPGSSICSRARSLRLIATRPRPSASSSKATGRSPRSTATSAS